MYTVLFFTFVLISVLWMEAFFNIKLADSICISQLALVVILYLFYAIDYLKIGVYAVFAANMLLFVCALIVCLKKRKLKETVVNIFVDKSFLIYCCLLILLYVGTRNRVPFWGDELRYWASVPKVLYEYDGALQLKSGYQMFSVDYIPGIVVYQYFLQIMNGTWSDSLLFFGYGAILFALCLPITSNIKRWQGVLISTIIIFIMPLFFFHTKANDYAIFNQSLYIDPILGVSVGCLMWFLFRKPWRDRITLIEYILCSSFIVLMKSSGIAFVLVNDIFIIVYLLVRDKQEYKKKSVYFIICVPILIQLSWSYLLKKYEISKELDYSLKSILSSDFALTYLKALITKSIFKPWLGKAAILFSFFVCFILVSVCLITLYFAMIKIKDTDIAYTKLIVIDIYVQIIIYVIGLYGLCSGAFHNQLNSYSRYICTVLEMVVCFIISSCIYNWDELSEVAGNLILNSHWFARLFTLSILVILAISPVRIVNNYADTYPKYIVDDRQAISNTFSSIENEIDKDTWVSVALIYDEPVWDSKEFVSWAKQWCGHLLNSLSYESISHRVQIRQKHYFTSQIDVVQTAADGSKSCMLVDDDNFQKDVEYIVWLHGNYPEIPMHDWELYKVIDIDDKNVDLQMIVADGKPEEFYDYNLSGSGVK